MDQPRAALIAGAGAGLGGALARRFARELDLRPHIEPW
jgi:NAD(P)-dependent dehydrogenase (short-subunit alcohol dehydrogenase family)